MKILVADDHAVVRKGLKEMLEDLPERPQIGEAADGQAALDKLRNEVWDALVLDLSMPGVSGMEVLRQALHDRPDLKVLVLSMHPEEQFAVRLLKAGAAAYLAKETAPDELVAAVRKVISGGRYISPNVAERLAYEVGSPDRPLHEALSDREFQVMRLIARGKAVKEIADELSLSVKTVSTYRARILDKLRLRSNADIIRYAIQHQLVE